VAVRSIEVRRLGTIAYGEALELQRFLVEERRWGRVGDVLLLLRLLRRWADQPATLRALRR